ncbi:MAG TPA: adenylate/guanylate cyclase domain-containing protein [Gaiellaceae bacterium]|nr:adenylate/guanylate cyclase domain-containing protein [Gaiellaceae bacterium]
MQICPNCGEENPPRFRLCGFCGAALAPEFAAPEVRKVVSIVFSDLKGSTNLGEALDPESLREVMTRYFDEMRDILEEHGGRVEKYIGDAIMAVFGLPRAHEDDALRAVRAAFEMKQALAVLNDELDRRWGVRLTNRTGVNTGDVVAGDPTTGQRLVIGDAVNVAARLEQAAPALEILVGEPTYRLVRGGVEVEPVEPLELKGKSERVPAYRLLGVKAAAERERTLDSPFVGRDAELRQLRDELELATGMRSCRVVTLLADAGVGKSRLTDELVDAEADRRLVLRGRCLPYGKGITFWPLVEIVREAAQIAERDSPGTARGKLAALVGDDGAAIEERIASAVGLSDAEFPLEEIYWGVRKLFERLSAERTLLVLIEDIHWAELAFLDLIEQVGHTLRGPALILCGSRPDLLDVRPGWGTAENASVIELAPLSAADSLRVIEGRLGGGILPNDVAGRIIAAAEGNPFYVEQLASMLVDEGVLRREEGRWAVAQELRELSLPPTIQALLTARLDLLDDAERTVIASASVIGLSFAVEALAELVPEPVRDRLDEHLRALVEKHLIRPEARSGGDEPFYRFDHILIRDNAYQALLKRTRATLHEQFATWAERVNAERNRAAEYEELVGYHLEQAHLYLAELGPLDDHGLRLGERASVLLASAGRRAFARNDMAAAATLLRRAVQLRPERDPERLALLPDLGEALTDTGELAWAELFLTEAIDAAKELGDERLAAEAELGILVIRRFAERLDTWTANVLAATERAIPIFEQRGDDGSLARAWRLIANANGVASRFGEAAEAAQRAGEHARRAGDRRLQTRAASGYAMTALYGPTPVADAIARCEQVLEETWGDKRLEGVVMCLLAPLRAMQGDFDAARGLYSKGRALLEEIGATLIAANTALNGATVEMLAGDPTAAERELRATYELLAEMDEAYLRPTVAAYLAEALSAQGRFLESEAYAQIARQVAAEDDIGSQALWRSVRAKILAQDEDYDGAIDLALEAVELLRGTDGIVGQADAMIVLADALQMAGRRSEADEVRAGALALYEQKGNAVLLARNDPRPAKEAAENL